VERVRQLRVSLERCQERVKYCERQLSDFVKSADMSDPRQQRCWKKLGSDLERAENDVRWIQKQLDDLRIEQMGRTALAKPLALNGVLF
jgi:hypothetical protein